jgi:hypothetical protein
VHRERDTESIGRIYNLDHIVHSASETELGRVVPATKNNRGEATDIKKWD